MAELLQRFSGNPFSTAIGQKIEQATDASLSSENWALNMEICDLINDTDEGPRDAVRAIRKRLQQNAGKNFAVVMYTLTLLEACVKNCGRRFHVLVTNKDFVQELFKLIGPKNDPPQAVQEKVLSLIQTWTITFRDQSDMQGVVQVYNELKSKGIEFPMSDLESTAPIHTPQRGASGQPQSSQPPVKSSGSIVPGPDFAAVAVAGPRRMVPLHLSQEQLAKLKSELDVVQGNMKVFGEMLNELVPGKEHSDDWELLNELNNTCQAMQVRIVDLIEKVANEEVTNELLRVNDEMNNLFLRFERHSKRRNPKPNEPSPIHKPEAAVAAAAAVPSVPTAAAQPRPGEESLIDFTDDSGANSVSNRLAAIQLSGIGAAAASKPDTNVGDTDFDMFAQSRSETSKPPDVASSANNLQREQDFDEMERWLKDQPTNNQESISSSEFDRFLAERASALDRQPNISKPQNQNNLLS